MEKLKSRKFWATVVIAVIAIISGGAVGDVAHIEPLALAIAGMVSSVYVLVQGRIDRTNALAQAVAQVDWDKVERMLREFAEAQEAGRGQAEREHGLEDTLW